MGRERFVGDAIGTMKYLVHHPDRAIVLLAYVAAFYKGGTSFHNYKSTLPNVRVYEDGHLINCLGEEKQLDKEFDLIAVFGAGVEVFNYEKNVFEPNDSQKLRLAAAAKLYLDHGANIPIILLGENYLSGEISKKYLRETVKAMSEGSQELDEDDVIIEADSFNTGSNADALNRNSNEDQSVVGITEKFHILRATRLSCYHGVAMLGISAEHILLNTPEFIKLGLNIPEVGEKFWIRVKERLENISMGLDPMGEWQIDLKNYVRNR